MGFFDKNHESESPLGLLRAHTGTFMYHVKMGKSKFKNKGTVYDIFYDMDQTQFLLDQATRGSLYDFKKKIDYALWDAAVHKYSEDLGKLKKELLRLVDEGFSPEREEKEIEETQSEKEEETDWKLQMIDEMEHAEEKAKQREEEERLARKKALSALESRHMTEADCRELWRIIKELEKEFRTMNRIADDWFAVHGKKDGCAGALLIVTLLPVATMYGIFSIF